MQVSTLSARGQGHKSKITNLNQSIRNETLFGRVRAV